MHLILQKCKERFRFTRKQKQVSPFFTSYKLVFMKVFTLAILLTLSGLLQAHNLSGQDLNKIFVSLKMKNKPLKVVLKSIEEQTNLRFAYKSEDISSAATISLSVNHQSLNQVLTIILRNNGFTYEMADNVVIIKPYRTENIINPASAVPPDKLSAGQNSQTLPDAARVIVTGLVTDENSQPLPGVTVKLKGIPFNITSTDADGKYGLNAQTNQVLVFSYVGFKTQEIKIDADNAAIINVKMEPSFGALKEVVVVGYGKQSKETLTGSISSISGADLVQVPNPNITQSLAGRLPGLIAFTNSGLPGQNDATLYVRGLSSTNDNSPLVVIDGIVRSNFASANGALSPLNINPLSYLDPNDIESISLLKDAAATAIYGARAANGVILVTTKRGTEGATTISYTASAGIQKSVFIAQPLDSYTTALMWNQAWQNEGTFAPTSGGAKGFTDQALDAIKNGTDPNRYSNTNWYKAILGSTPAQTEHNLSISGGTPKTRYFISAGYFDQDGFYSGTGFKRYNIRSNIDGKISNNLDFELNISGRQEQGNNVNSSPAASTFFISPLEPIQFTNGTYYYYPNIKGNPYLTSKGYGGYNDITKDYFESSGSLTYKVPHVQGLTVKGLISFDKYYVFNKIFTTTYNAYTLNDDNTYTLPLALSSTLPTLTENYSQFQSLTEEASVNYDHTFGLHHVNGLLLYTQTQNTGDNFSAGRVNFPSAILDQLNEGSLTGLTNSGSGLQNARRGVVGRIGYDYNLKYLAEFDARYDGSDLFPPGQRYGFFPAVSVGWRLSEESFIKDHLSFITNLKLRASWGQAGNDRAGAFQYLNSYAIATANQQNLGAYGFGGTAATPVSVLDLATLANSVFTWERATTVNIGLDANLWKDLLGIEIDVFKKRTSDILLNLSAQVPAVFGAPTGTLPLENYGIVDNKGIEIQLSHQNSIGQFHYFIRPNVTFNRSDVIRYPQGASVPPGQLLQGKPVSPDAVIGYVADGLYQSQAEINAGPTPLISTVKPGDIKYKDVNNDGKITAADEVIISRGRTPQVIYGINTGFSYKGLDLNVFFQGAADAVIYLPSNITDPFYMYNPYPVAFSLEKNSWTPTNTNATYPRLTVTSQNNLQPSSYWIKNGAYLRLKNAEIGYTLPAGWTKSLGLKSTRLFINGNNLLTFSHVKNMVDPESQFNTYPLIQVFNLGISVKL
jgi:TonB-linked SusC/RagA family outer membrane protein